MKSNNPSPPNPGHIRRQPASPAAPRQALTSTQPGCLDHPRVGTLTRRAPLLSEVSGDAIVRLVSATGY